MKKYLISISATMVLMSLFIIQSCKKDDTTAPVITLNGSSTQTISLNSSYSDAGATASDDEDGSVSVTSDASSSNPNVNLAGTYTITYHATDAAGNVGTASRTVIVKNDADYLAGTYTTVEGAFTWTQTITASTTENNKIKFSKFANYINDSTIVATVVGIQVGLGSAQNGIGIGPSACTHTFTPNGTGNSITTSPTISFSIKFTDQEIVGGSGCPGTGVVPYEDVFTKQ
jgi:hypothetical protein